MPTEFNNDVGPGALFNGNLNTLLNTLWMIGTDQFVIIETKIMVIQGNGRIQA